MSLKGGTGAKESVHGAAIVSFPSFSQGTQVPAVASLFPSLPCSCLSSIPWAQGREVPPAHLVWVYVINLSSFSCHFSWEALNYSKTVHWHHCFCAYNTQYRVLADLPLDLYFYFFLTCLLTLTRLQRIERLWRTYFKSKWTVLKNLILLQGIGLLFFSMAVFSLKK